MPAEDPTDLTVAELGQRYRDGGCSPVDVVEAYLARIERLNPGLNAYWTVTAERARTDAARAADELRAGRDRGALHGVPIGLKDLVDTAGIRTPGGAKFFADRVPDTDAAVARRLRDAGAVLLGKLATHELAWGVTTTNPHFGPTRNPWDRTRIPGGSSGGSAAATAAHLAAATIGTDTGGSIRIPAALCGVVGLKPTFGRVSRAGVIAMSSLLDHVGPLARTVEDAALVLEAIAGYDPDDPATVPMPLEAWAAACGAPIGGLRVGVAREPFFALLDPEVRAAVDAACGVLHDLGARLHDVALPVLPLDEAMAVVVAEGQVLHAGPLATRFEDFGADLRAFLGLPPFPSDVLVRGLYAGHAWTVAARRALADVDVLALPTVPAPAARIGEETVRVGDVELTPFFAYTTCTPHFDVAGLPAISLPCGFTRDGLPIGLQIVGRPFEECTVLRAAHAYEAATPWHTRRPPA